MSTTISTHQPPDSITALLKEASELPDPNRSLLTHNESELVRFCGRLAAALAAAEDRAVKLDEQLRPGSPTERAPTLWAYEQACKALETHRGRADDAETKSCDQRAVLNHMVRFVASNVTMSPARFSALCDQAIKSDPELACVTALPTVVEVGDRGLGGAGALPPPLVFNYKNWCGESGVRRAFPIRTFFGSTEWHPAPGWLMEAWDVDKGALRVFAMGDMAPVDDRIAKLLMRSGMLASLVRYIQPGKPMTREVVAQLVEDAQHILREVAELGVRHAGVTDAQHEALLAPATSGFPLQDSYGTDAGAVDDIGQTRDQ
jgi:hypothetical protein